ncbi:MAG TPA: hypothetical protein O0X32_01465 [Methanocorpusculum sp.]|nr:hypothetical protein [Methanocorpusculum sp.]
MWENLPEKERDDYKMMILAFASLTEMFSQKADKETSDSIIRTPIINSKFQESVFQRSFHAHAEDIGNTSFDASISLKIANACMMRYLIGIKTFGKYSGAQKVAQFKSDSPKWNNIIQRILENAKKSDGTSKSKTEIDEANHELYLDLARKIAELRNIRILSSKANLQGFTIDENDAIESVYHILMPYIDGDIPKIDVSETSYDLIDVAKISVDGCTGANNPANFNFNDGNHHYRYTNSDSQLLMEFKDAPVKDSWNVKYIDNAYEFFKDLARKLFADDEINQKETIESYSWEITNRKGEVELFSGFNSFYGTGSKLDRSNRLQAIEKLNSLYKKRINLETLREVIENLTYYLMEPAGKPEEKLEKVLLRDKIKNTLNSTGDVSFKNDVMKYLYRPVNEMYIPIPDSINFHHSHPKFFCKNIGEFSEGLNGTVKLELSKSAEDRCFNLIFEPSGKTILAFITQDAGKAIESMKKQSYLGEWILKGVFQLRNYEPLTVEKLEAVKINGIRVFKVKDSDDVHLEFIWIDSDNLPNDYVGK